MIAYILRRLLLIIPTLFGIMLVNFVTIQAAPGGPVELTLARIKGTAGEATARVGGGAGGDVAARQATRAGAGEGSGQYRGARGMDPELIRQLEKLYGFDRPPT